MPMDAITMVGLSKRYGHVEALSDVSLAVRSGSVFGFLSPNGAAQSPALKILAGLTRASGGTAAISGVPVAVSGAHRRYLGYLAQNPEFYGWMTGRETLRYVAQFRESGRDSERSIDELL